MLPLLDFTRNYCTVSGGVSGLSCVVYCHIIVGAVTITHAYEWI